jgi:hypothetical protein
LLAEEGHRPEAVGHKEETMRSCLGRAALWRRGCNEDAAGTPRGLSGENAAATARGEVSRVCRGCGGFPLPLWGNWIIGSGSTGFAMLRAASLHPLLHSGAPLGRRWCGGRWGIYG